MEHTLTEGSVSRAAARYSVPFLLSYLLQSLYGMADLYVMGLYSDTSGTTAVSVGSQVMHVLTVLFMGLAMGTTVTTARAVGAATKGSEEAKREVSRTVGTSLTLFGILSLLSAAVLICLVRPVTALMSTPAAAAADCSVYLTICFAGIPFITAYNVFAALYRAAGDSLTPLYFVAMACAANIGLDFLFTGVLGLGAAGVALGTVLAQALSAVFAMIRTGKSGFFRLTFGDFRPVPRIIRSVMKIGVPVMVQDGLIQVTFIVITVLANRRGLDDAAAVGIVEKMIGIFFMLPSTMLSTVSALGSMNIGAGKPDRALRTLRFAVLTALSWGLCVSVTMQFAAESVVGLFSPSSSVVRLGGTYLRGYIWDCALAGVHFCFSGYFNALGRSEFSFLHNFLSMLCVRIPFAYFASIGFPDTLFPMGMASTAGSTLSILICAAVFLSLRRKGKSEST